MPAPYRRLGRVTTSHGTDGEVVLALRDDFPVERLVGIDVWFVPPPERGARPARAVTVRAASRGVIVRFDGIESREGALDLAGRSLLARDADLPLEAEDVDDLQGYVVIDRERGVIGSIAETIVTGANDVWVVQGGPFGQVLIPVIDDVVLDVDRAARAVHVALLTGLLEEEA